MNCRRSTSDRTASRFYNIFQKSKRLGFLYADRDAAIGQEASTTPESIASTSTISPLSNLPFKWIPRSCIPILPRRSRPFKFPGHSESTESKSASNEGRQQSEQHSDVELTSLDSISSPISDTTIVDSQSTQGSESESETLGIASDTLSHPTTPDRNDHALPPPEAAKQQNLEAAIADLRAADFILHERHQNIKVQPNFSKKLPPLTSNVNGTGHERNKAQTPDALAPSTHTHINVANTTGESESDTAVQRRMLIKNLAMNAVGGCPTAIAMIEQVNSHAMVKAQYPEMKTCDLVLKINGVHVHASQFGIVERNWIERYNAIANINTLAARRHLSTEDHEIIVSQLFPKERGPMLKPQEFNIFLHSLSEESILTRGQAKTLSRLKVSIEEFHRGASFTGLSPRSQPHSQNLKDLVLFHMPNEPTRSISFPPIRTTIKGLFHHLTILSEAAAYNQTCWKGYYFPHARSTLSNFHEAYTIDQDDWLLPPYLTAYKRPWTYRETRTLLRAHLVCDLLKRWETGAVTDFGIVRVVRATYVRIPAQPYFSLEELQSFLYHRVTDSGLAVRCVPEILALHPENDVAFSDARMRSGVVERLRDSARLFEEEEKERMKSIEVSHATFLSARKSQIGRWERMRMRFKEAFGKKGEVVPFDPFAPEHKIGE